MSRQGGVFWNLATSSVHLAYQLVGAVQIARLLSSFWGFKLSGFGPRISWLEGLEPRGALTTGGRLAWVQGLGFRGLKVSVTSLLRPILSKLGVSFPPGQGAHRRCPAEAGEVGLG